MIIYKIFNIFVLLFLIKSCTTKPIEDDYSDITPKHELFNYVLDNMSILGQKYIEKIVDLSHQIQKDESLELHDEVDILEFKQNVNNFIENYNTNSPLMVKLYTTKHFVESVEYYLKLTDEQLTPEFKFIVELLEKYKYRELEDECKQDTRKFIDGFKMKFEEIKEHLDEPLLEWYEKFSNLKEEEQIMDFEMLAEYI